MINKVVSILRQGRKEHVDILEYSIVWIRVSSGLDVLHQNRWLRGCVSGKAAKEIKIPGRRQPSDIL